MRTTTPQKTLVWTGTALFAMGVAIALATYASTIVKAALTTSMLVVQHAERLGARVPEFGWSLLPVPYASEPWHGVVLLMTAGLVLVVVGSYTGGETFRRSTSET